MIVTTLNLEKREELDSLEAEFKSQIIKLENNEKEMIENINNSKIQLQDMQKELFIEVSKREEIEDELLRRGSGYEEEVAMRLQFESRLNQMYAKMRDLQTKIMLMSENLEDMSSEVKIRTESLQKEKTKNIQLVKIRTEIENEMKRTEEQFKQTDNININLEKRITECYEQIETLNIKLTNLNTSYNEALNNISQKKIENDELRSNLELFIGKANRTQEIILEYELEKGNYLTRINELEGTLLEEVSNNKFFHQEYVKIKESDKINFSELEKYKNKSDTQEIVLEQLQKDKDTLIIKLESMTISADEYKAITKDLQIKLEEMNKGRRIAEEMNEFLKGKLEEKTKEVKENRVHITVFKEQQDRMKIKEIDLEGEIIELKFKLQHVQKQYDTTKDTLEEKVSNLHEILESEKQMREH